MKSAKKSRIMQKSDSDLDEFDDDMSYEEVIILFIIVNFCFFD
jgi:hypothetical protein